MNQLFQVGNISVGVYDDQNFHTAEVRIGGAGADLIDEYASINVMLEDVPGDTPLDKVRRLKTWYLEFQNASVRDPKFDDGRTR